MTYPISQQAINFVRKRATEVMISECVIERINKPSFDEANGRAVPGSRETIYEGPCRIWEVQGGGPVVISEEDITMQSTQLSIPWATSPVPRRDDEVTITDSRDDELIGKRFVIDSSAKSGELRPTRRFSVRGYQK